MNTRTVICAIDANTRCRFAAGRGASALVDSPRSGVVGEGPGVRRGWIGQPGNGDGWVCAVQLGNQLTPFGLPVYNFIDNQLPA